MRAARPSGPAARTLRLSEAMTFGATAPNSAREVRRLRRPGLRSPGARMGAPRSTSSVSPNSIRSTVAPITRPIGPESPGEGRGAVHPRDVAGDARRDGLAVGGRDIRRLRGLEGRGLGVARRGEDEHALALADRERQRPPQRLGAEVRAHGEGVRLERRPGGEPRLGIPVHRRADVASLGIGDDDEPRSPPCRQHVLQRGEPGRAEALEERDLGLDDADPPGGGVDRRAARTRAGRAPEASSPHS